MEGLKVRGRTARNTENGMKWHFAPFAHSFAYLAVKSSFFYRKDAKKREVRRGQFHADTVPAQQE